MFLPQLVRACEERPTQLDCAVTRPSSGHEEDAHPRQLGRDIAHEKAALAAAPPLVHVVRRRLKPPVGGVLSRDCFGKETDSDSYAVTPEKHTSTAKLCWGVRKDPSVLRVLAPGSTALSS